MNSNLDPISHSFRDTTTYSFKIPLKIAAKPLQMDIWLPLTAYRKSPPPYPMVPSQTPYHLPFNHNTAQLALHSALSLFKVIQD